MLFKIVMQSKQLKSLPKFSRFLSHTSASTQYFDLHYIFFKENSIKYVKSFKSLCPRLNTDNKRQAAVLIPLCIVKDEVSLLYTLRTSNLKRNSSQVSFPGGMHEMDEKLQDTALRESCEELGISERNIGVIDPDMLNVNHEEVQYAFAIPLKHFCEPANCKYTYFRQKSNRLMVLPVYTNDYKKIWGMTAYMTWLALKSIIPEKFTQSISSSLYKIN
ncbi:nucleoside diphosphate-linked moiety X motif 8 isoform X2 [Sipha flava]|uniref:Nucleoside diphosphate-linked moiety X motif 8 isoform X2 n=1 Tax=Sipha flava TaxID=143950 RepID=A0A8B8FFD8_9HEMI|nr:nucleoside diphosphate-linked moiety X motif 8 isoform X2 [Sipha flava]